MLGLNDLVRFGPQDQRAPARIAARFIRPGPLGSLTRPARRRLHGRDLGAPAFGGLTDDQIANAYGATGLYGAGEPAPASESRSTSSSRSCATSGRSTPATSAPRGPRRCWALTSVTVDGGQPPGPGAARRSSTSRMSRRSPRARTSTSTGPARTPTFDALDEYAAIIDADRDQIVRPAGESASRQCSRASRACRKRRTTCSSRRPRRARPCSRPPATTGRDDCNTRRPRPGQPGRTLFRRRSRQPAVRGRWAEPRSTTPLSRRSSTSGTTARGGGGGGGISAVVADAVLAARRLGAGRRPSGRRSAMRTLTRRSTCGVPG